MCMELIPQRVRKRQGAWGMLLGVEDLLFGVGSWRRGNPWTKWHWITVMGLREGIGAACDDPM